MSFVVQGLSELFMFCYKYEVLGILLYKGTIDNVLFTKTAVNI